jgi:hypothetical protein
MPNPLDNLVFNPVNQTPAPQQYGQNGCTFMPSVPCDLKDIIQRARQNPQWLEQEVQRVNPQGYQQALQIRNSANPMQALMQMAQANRVHPSILQYLGLG